jgi:hypothetical protein
MNLDRFHTILKALVREFQEQQIVQKLKVVATTLANSVGQPTPDNAAAFRKALQELNASLAACPSNAFVPSARHLLDVIGASTKTGNGLTAVLNQTLEANQITPAAAVERVQVVHRDVAKFSQQASVIAQAFAEIGVPEDTPLADKYEIGFLVPASIVDGQVGPFGKELSRLDAHLRTITEVVGHPVASAELRALSSGSFELFLSSAPVVAACLMTAVERLVALYKTILEIRQLRQLLEQKNVPAAAVELIKKEEHQRVEKAIDGLADELLAKYYKPPDKSQEARRNELRTGLVKALRYLADRIDRGVDIEARPGPEEAPPAGAAPTPPDPAGPRAIVSRIGPLLVGLQRAADPVLRLPEGSEDLPRDL